MNESDPLLARYPLWTLYFYLTGDCNLACRHCWINPQFQKTMVSQFCLDYQLIIKIIDEAKPLGLRSVKLTGGEPLIHPRISEILSHIKNEDLELTIESNGVALTPDLASKIADCKNSFISISLDGCDAEMHEWVRGVHGSYGRAINGIRSAVDAGMRPQIIMTVFRRNIHQVESLVCLAEQLGAGSVKFNILQPVARGKSLHDQGENLPIEELIRLGSHIERKIAPKATIPVFFGHTPAFQPMGRMFQNNCSCGTCHIHHILGVLHDGSYALCGIGMTAPEMIFGNAVCDHLLEIWSTNETLQKIREGVPDLLEGICRECVMKNICLGGCIAQNYVSSRNVLAPYWYCDEAERKGLFPESRLQFGKKR